MCLFLNIENVLEEVKRTLIPMKDDDGFLKEIGKCFDSKLHVSSNSYTGLKLRIGFGKFSNEAREIVSFLEGF